MGFTVKRVLRRVLRRGSEKGGFQKVPGTPPCRVRPLRRAHSCALIFIGCRCSLAQYVAEWAVAPTCLRESKCQGAVSHPIGDCAGSDSVPRDKVWKQYILDIFATPMIVSPQIKFSKPDNFINFHQKKHI